MTDYPTTSPDPATSGSAAVAAADPIGSRRIGRGALLGLAALVVGTLVEMVHLLLTQDPHPLVGDGLHDTLIIGAGVGCLVAVGRHRWDRAAWQFLAAGVLSIGAGEVVWTALYSDAEVIPYPNLASPFYLACYPLFMAGIVLLVKRRMTRFEVYRWLDGLVIVLIVVIPMVALVLKPILDNAQTDLLGQVVTLIQPIGDLLLLGALLGAVPLIGWRVDASWIWLSVGLIWFTVSDAYYAVAAIQAEYYQSDVDFLWAAGSVAIAIAAWIPSRHPGEVPELLGWRAILLPLGAQLIAAGIQLYLWLGELYRLERLLTLAVLGIGIAQVVATRPRRPAASSSSSSDGQVDRTR